MEMMTNSPFTHVVSLEKLSNKLIINYLVDILRSLYHDYMMDYIALLYYILFSLKLVFPNYLYKKKKLKKF